MNNEKTNEENAFIVADKKSDEVKEEKAFIVADTETKDEAKEEVKEEKTKKTKKPNKVLEFVITTMNGMAHGLFATLIIGTIINTIGGFFPDGTYMEVLIQTIGKFLQNMTGVGIGLGVAHSMKIGGLKLVSLAAVGALASFLNINLYAPDIAEFGKLALRIGDPLTIYLVVVFSMLLGNLILRKKTPVDILVVPMVIVTLGTILTLILNFPISYVTKSVGYIVGVATEAVPFLMGIIISVIMGMALTAPISSAAIAAMILTIPAGTDPATANAIAIAGGAAVLGCSVNMVGFAVQSIYDNNIGKVISVGIGTSMLQFKNILRKPIVWLPTIIVSAILGPVSTCLLKLQCTGASAGMGTSGLVGQIGMFASMGNTWQTWVGIFGLHIILPAILTFGVDFLFRKFGLIKKGDLTI